MIVDKKHMKSLRKTPGGWEATYEFLSPAGCKMKVIRTTKSKPEMPKKLKGMIAKR